MAAVTDRTKLNLARPSGCAARRDVEGATKPWRLLLRNVSDVVVATPDAPGEALDA